MIELFSRRNEAIILPEDAILSPLPLDDELSSLSAILIDDDYYKLLLDGRILIKNVPTLTPGHLIPLKMKAWLDLSERKDKGESIDSKNVKKHKNDIIRLSMLLTSEVRISVTGSILSDITTFLSAMEHEDIDLKQLGIRNQSREDVITKIKNVYI